jgi:hypothetical protein
MPTRSSDESTAKSLALGGEMQISNKAAFKLGMAIAGILGATAASAVDLENGDWKFSVNGNINVDYIYSSCQSAA